jgi:AcrR family transcriptional regulator
MSKPDTASTSNAAAAANQPRVGRPPTIDADAILQAALEIGLERVTLKQLADHLGVAISTLYRHVRNRDELVRLAASQHLLTRGMPDSGQQHWTDVAIHHSESLFESFVAEPQLITEFMKGRMGPDVEADFLEWFLTVIRPHGFTPAEGVYLYRAIGMLTLGGAIGALAAEAAEQAGASQQVVARRVLAERDPGKLPLLRQAAQEYGSLDPHTWRRAVKDLIAGIAQSRGEQARPNSKAIRKPASKRNKSAAGAAKAAPDQRQRRGKPPSAVSAKRKNV